MRQQFTVGTKLMAGSALMVGLVSVLCVAWLASLNSFRDRLDIVIEKTLRKTLLAEDVALAESEMVSAQRGVVLSSYSKNQKELQSYTATFRLKMDLALKSANEIMALTVTEEGRRLAEDFVARVNEWRPHFETLLQQAEAGNAEAANQTRTVLTAPIYMKLGEDAKRFVEMEKEMLVQDQQDLNDSHSRTRWYAMGLLALGLAISAGMLWVVRGVNTSLRRAFAELMNGAREFAGTAQQVSASSQSLAQGSSEQAASIQEMSASTREINTVALKNQAGSEAAAELATASQRRFQDANRSLEEMIVAMGEINSSSEKISKIIRVIDEIAFQTNILALNAAVEAARAGEAGMGFAVVADEVRNLAQRSATAARDTSNLIEGSIAASHAGSIKVNDVAMAIRGIAEDNNQVKALVDQVSSHSHEQARGLEVIARSLAQVEQVTQRAAASAEESAAASEELTSQSEALKHIVRNLSAMVGGESASGGSSAEPMRRLAQAR